jgi:hypothetical protein
MQYPTRGFRTGTKQGESDDTIDLQLQSNKFQAVFSMVTSIRYPLSFH